MKLPWIGKGVVMRGEDGGFSWCSSPMKFEGMFNLSYRNDRNLGKQIKTQIRTFHYVNKYLKEKWTSYDATACAKHYYFNFKRYNLWKVENFLMYRKNCISQSLTFVIHNSSLSGEYKSLLKVNCKFRAWRNM